MDGGCGAGFEFAGGLFEFVFELLPDRTLPVVLLKTVIVVGVTKGVGPLLVSAEVNATVGMLALVGLMTTTVPDTQTSPKALR